MANVWFLHHADGTAADVQFDYDPAMVDIIKMVPSFGRSWAPKPKKTWTVRQPFLADLATRYRAAGHSVQNVTLPPKPAPKPPPPPPPMPTALVSKKDWADLLFERCDTPELRVKVFRALSKVFHTDLGGDGAMQQELNDARARGDQQQTG